MKIPLFFVTWLFGGQNVSVNINDHGRTIVLSSFVVAGLSLLFFGFHAVSILLIVIALCCTAFFRDPDRFMAYDPSAIFSSADGTVSMITEDLPHAELELAEEKMTRVSVFLSVTDVHVNRIPVSGKIVRINYNPGSFINASMHKDSLKNERNSIVIQSESGSNIVCTQIAGLIARRIICDAEVGSFVAAGDRFGIIKFGSRVDLYFPKSYVVKVLVGQKVIGGETVIAKIDNII